MSDSLLRAVIASPTLDSHEYHNRDNEYVNVRSVQKIMSILPNLPTTVFY